MAASFPIALTAAVMAAALPAAALSAPEAPGERVGAGTERVVTAHSGERGPGWSAPFLTTSSSTAYPTLGPSTTTRENARAERMAARQADYVRAHHGNVLADMAAGGGWHLMNLATLLGCPYRVRDTLYAAAQQHFADLHPAPDTAPADTLARLRQLLRDQPRTAQACRWV